jgi:hypothetical protein
LHLRHIFIGGRGIVEPAFRAADISNVDNRTITRNDEGENRSRNARPIYRSRCYQRVSGAVRDLLIRAGAPATALQSIKSISRRVTFRKVRIAERAFACEVGLCRKKMRDRIYASIAISMKLKRARPNP